MPTPPGIEVGDDIYELRRHHGLTQVEVARAWGRPQANLSEIERNQRRMSYEAASELFAAIEKLAAEKTRAKEAEVAS